MVRNGLFFEEIITICVLKMAKLSVFCRIF